MQSGVCMDAYTEKTAKGGVLWGCGREGGPVVTTDVRAWCCMLVYHIVKLKVDIKPENYPLSTV